MRIAYVAGTVLPSRVAAAVNIPKMCRSLAATGHGVTLYARGRQADAAAVFAEFGLERRFDLVLRAPSVSSAAGREIGRWMSPLEVFEHMAAGKPILASDIPALREILRDGDTALLLPPSGQQAWADAARALLRDPGRAAALGVRARAVRLSECTWDVRAARILAHLPRRTGAAAA